MKKFNSKEMAKVKIPELIKKLEETQVELSTLRVAQVTGGAASKVGKIKQTRKNIARVLTVINQKARRSYAKQVEELPNNQKPKSLRAKKTRAIRRALTKKELGAQTIKQKKKIANYAGIKYAVKA